MSIEGKVFAQFVIDKRGNLTGIKILRGVDPLLDNEVVEALKNSPQWKPGMQNGQPVKVAMSMPISFQLRH